MMNIVESINIIPRPEMGSNRVVLVAALVRQPGETDAAFDARTMAASVLLMNVSAPYRTQTYTDKWHDRTCGN